MYRTISATPLRAILAAAAVIAFVAPAGAIDGKLLYEKHCQKCHAADGKGDTKAGKMTKTPDITTVDWKQGTTVEELSKTLEAKLGKMPSFSEKLSAEERKAVSTYTIDLVQ